jgi:hypothetical protein
MTQLQVRGVPRSFAVFLFVVDRWTVTTTEGHFFVLRGVPFTRKRYDARWQQGTGSHRTEYVITLVPLGIKPPVDRALTPRPTKHRIHRYKSFARHADVSWNDEVRFLFVTVRCIQTESEAHSLLWSVSDFWVLRDRAGGALPSRLPTSCHGVVRVDGSIFFFVLRSSLFLLFRNYEGSQDKVDEMAGHARRAGNVRNCTYTIVVGNLKVRIFGRSCVIISGRIVRDWLWVCVLDPSACGQGQWRAIVNSLINLQLP